jgi:hypothetical protein
VLHTIDQAFDSIAQAVDGPIKGAGTIFVAASRDGNAHPVASRILADVLAAVGLVADDAPGSQPRPPRTGSFDGTLSHELFESRRFVPLTRGQDECHQLAVAFGSDVDLGAEAALTAAERFRRRVPFFAPAACWCARTMVLST